MVKTMGKYDDFELDLSVKSMKKNVEIRITSYSPVSDLTNSYAQSCYSWNKR